MSNAFKPVIKQNLADRLARRIQGLIQQGEYREGDRLPSIMEMAKSFGVGHPTLREALKKLETMGVLEIRHGSGVYVTRSHEVLMVAADYSGAVTKKLLTDLIQARTPLEIHSAQHAARNARPENLEEMRRLLTTAGENMNNDAVLNASNISFHREIAKASGNTVLTQVLEVLGELFNEEQRLILGIGSRERDHQEHLGILEAIEHRDEGLAVERMRTHLAGVEAAIRRWDPQHRPI